MSTADAGKKLSLRISLTRSAIGWRRPNGPARFGPYRSCIRPISLRSTQVMYANASRTRLTIRNAFATSIHQGSLTIVGKPPVFRRLGSLYPVRERTDMFLGGADDAGRHVRVDDGAKLDGRAVGAHPNGVSVADRAQRGVVRRELELSLRTQELKLGHALDGGAGEERAVADELQRAAARGSVLRRRRQLEIAERRPGRK